MKYGAGIRVTWLLISCHIATFVELFAKKVMIMMSSLRTVSMFSGIFAGQSLIRNLNASLLCKVFI